MMRTSVAYLKACFPCGGFPPAISPYLWHGCMAGYPYQAPLGLRRWQPGTWYNPLHFPRFPGDRNTRDAVRHITLLGVHFLSRAGRPRTRVHQIGHPISEMRPALGPKGRLRSRAEQECGVSCSAAFLRSNRCSGEQSSVPRA